MNIETWKKMMSGGSQNTPKVIAQLIGALKPLDDDEYLNQVIMLSARQKDLKRQVMERDKTNDQAEIAQIRINKALLYTLDELDEYNVFGSDKTSELEKTSQSIPESVEVNSSSPTLDDLKKLAKYTQELLGSLRTEKQMTMPGKAEFVIQNQIEEAEKELESLKSQIITHPSIS